ncbi:SUKH-4 family immunity protein [Streptomyces sp. NPDC006134]|uniref:SUKH-4 family immunity protein n=1 Tax=Streptomyces sp. NPDC006134 TaxID=3154467 RepID=UPI0033F65429
MVTFAQAQERAEEWINGDVPAYQHREVRVREFELGFVVWPEDRADGPRSDGGAQRLVIARDSGEATLWPALPVGEVIRRYEEEYGRPDTGDEPAPAAPAARVDLNQTSFLLTPPEWLQEAADRMGGSDRRGGGAEEGGSEGSGAGDAGAGSGGGGGGVSAPGAPVVPPGATPWTGTDTSAYAEDDRSVPLPETVSASPSGDADDEPPAVPATPAVPPQGMSGPPTPPPPGVPGTPSAPGAPVGGYVPTQVVSVTGPEGPQGPGGAGAPQPSGPPGPPVPSEAPVGPGMPGTPGAPQPSGPPGPPGPSVPPGVPGASGVPGAPQPPGPPGVPGVPGGPGGPGGAPGGQGSVHHADTMLAAPPVGGPGTPPPPPVPGTPPPAPGAPAGHGAPPPMPPGAVPPPGQPQSGVMPQPGAMPPPGQPQSGAVPPPGQPQSGVMPQPGAMPPPGQPQPGAVPQPGQPQPGVMPQPGAVPPPGQPQSGAVPQPGQPQPGVMPQPGAVPPPGQPQPGAVPQPGQPQSGVVPQPGAMPPPGQPQPGGPVPGQSPAYGYPQPPVGQPTVGPGYQAVLRYRAQDGSEQQLIRRSAPGMPHPEWQIFHELRAMNVPPGQVLELHTELESCELPGAYCARMIREQWPQARITSIAPYGTDHASRQQGMQQLLAHQGELHQVADGPARPAPVRAPLPPVQALPPVPPEAVAQELAGAFGPGIFRFEQQAVSRQGVPPVVAHTLVVAGLPVDMGPFFWAQAQPGRPVPTLAELAAERGVQPAPDAGSYLVVGSDFGKAICVQYGTAHIVAVPVEAGPGGTPVPPQFVNTGLPEFARCLALLGRMWRLRFGLNQEQAGRWTVDFQAQLAALDPAALGSPESWWSVLLEQMWDGLL